MLQQYVLLGFNQIYFYSNFSVHIPALLLDITAFASYTNRTGGKALLYTIRTVQDGIFEAERWLLVQHALVGISRYPAPGRS